MRITRPFTFLATFLIIAFYALPVFALSLINREKINMAGKTNAFQASAGFEQVDPYALIGTLISSFLSLLGVLFLGLLIYGGYLWMMAQGVEEEVAKAKKLITNAVIGLAVIMAAYAISAFVVDALQERTLTLERATTGGSAGSAGSGTMTAPDAATGR